MTAGPRTAAGLSLDAQFGAGQYGRVRGLVAAIETEARRAAFDEVLAAMDSVPSWDGDESFVMVKDVIQAVTELRDRS